MTREEAIEWFRSSAFYHKDHEPLNMAIKALEQEPCEDCISRQATIEAIEDDNRNGHYSCFASNNDAQCFKDVIRSLPPVTPKPKTDALDKIIAEIKMYEADCRLQGGTDECEKCNSNVFGSIYRIIDKYTAESEDKE